MKQALPGIYFAKLQNRKRIIILAYKIDCKIRFLCMELLLQIGKVSDEKRGLIRRLDLLSNASSRLSNIVQHDNLREL